MEYDEAAGSLQVLQALLLDIASDEESAAAREAAGVPYWAPCPPSVVAGRTAASVLRERAASLLEAGAA